MHALHGRLPVALVLLGCVSLALSGCEWLAGLTGGGKPALRLTVLECGLTYVKDEALFSPGVNEGKSRKNAVNCYLIQHPDGSLMWGTGLNDGLVLIPEGLEVAGGNLRITVSKPLAQQLRNLEISPLSITYVSMSHMHPDHSGNGNLFANATVLLQEEEYDAAFGDDPGRFAFNPDFYGQLADNTAIKLSGDHDVFGDGSVIIKRTVGHTPGHQSLFVDLPQTGPLVLSGDLWHFASQREHKRVPKFNYDKEATLASMDSLEAFSAEKGATVWIEHDFDQNQTIRHAPEYYE